LLPAPADSAAIATLFSAAAWCRGVVQRCPADGVPLVGPGVTLQQRRHQRDIGPFDREVQGSARGPVRGINARAGLQQGKRDLRLVA